MSIATRVIVGTMAAVIAALGMPRVSRAINSSFVKRQNGTDRHHNAPEGPQNVPLQKSRESSQAVPYLTIYAYDFCWPVMTIRIRGERRRGQQRGGAKAAGLADHVCSILDWIGRIDNFWVTCAD